MKRKDYLWRVLMVFGLVIAGVCVRTTVTWAGDFLDKFDYEEDVDMNINGWSGVPGWATFKGGIITLALPNPKTPVKETGLWMTSRYSSFYGKYTVKFMTTNDKGNFIYLGWARHDAAPNWMNPAAYITLYDTLHLVVGNGDHRSSSVETPKVTPNEWHTATIIWQPTAVELIYDGKSVGKVTDAACIPTQSLPLILDEDSQLESTPLILKVDEISVTAQ